MKTGPDNAVGYLTNPANNQETIFVVPQENESPEDAIKRVAAAHNVDPGSVTRGRPASKKLNPVDSMAAKLAVSIEEGDAQGALLQARAIVAELEKELRVGATKPRDDAESFEQATGRVGAVRSYLNKLDGERVKPPAGSAAATFDYDKLFPAL